MCICRQNTTIFISNILGIYHNRHNYMFRKLVAETCTCAYCKYGCALTMYTHITLIFLRNIYIYTFS